jgi:hypothetical protein
METSEWQEFLERSTVEIDGEVFYVVEGDIWYTTEDALQAYYEAMYGGSGETQFRSVAHLHHGTSDITAWTHQEAVDLKYCINSYEFDNEFDNELYDEVVEILRNSTAEWERVANVNFKHVVSEDGVGCNEQNGEVTFSVRGQDVPDYGAACATFPHHDGPNPHNCPYDYSLTISADQYVDDEIRWPSVFVHELGHKLGLSHEMYHPGDMCGTSSSNVTELTEVDPDSAMMYIGVCGKGDVPYKVSWLDGVGLRKLYGPPTSWYVATGVL